MSRFSSGPEGPDNPTYMMLGSFQERSSSSRRLLRVIERIREDLAVSPGPDSMLIESQLDVIEAELRKDAPDYSKLRELVGNINTQGRFATWLILFLKAVPDELEEFTYERPGLQRRGRMERGQFPSMMELEFAASLHETALNQESGANGRQPIAIYVEDESVSGAVEQALKDLLRAYGARISWRGRPISGSWFRRFQAWFNSSTDAQDIAVEIRRAIELKAVHEAQAKVDSAQAEAAAKLLQALEGTPKAVMHIGSILVVKTEEMSIVRTLTQRELAFLERNSHLMKDATGLIKALREADSTSRTHSTSATSWDAGTVER